MPFMFRRWRLTWPVLIALVAILARVIPTPRTIDDAFITFRYARNLLEGSGFVFNAGQRVLGTTTPLYTLLLAGLAWTLRTQNYPWLALWVNALADAATCLLLVALGDKLTGRRAVGLGAALLWAIAPMSVTFAIGGMETSVFILLLVGTAYCYVTGRTRLAAIAGGLLVLTRPDGLLLAAPLGLDLLVRRLRARHDPASIQPMLDRGSPAAEALLFLATVLPWAVFATAYFGSPIPHSVLAKSVAYRVGALDGLINLLQHYGTPFFEERFLSRFWPLAGFILYLALSLVGGLSLVRRDSRAWPIALFPWLYFTAYAAARILIFRWYLAPPLPFYFLLILAGLDRLLSEATATGRGRALAQRINPLAVPVGVFLFFSVCAWTLLPDHGPTEPAPEMAWHKLELYYAQVGRALAPRLTPASVVAAGDVGALGYYSRARILDTVGLMSPEATAYYPLDPSLYTIIYSIPPLLILNQKPDYVVLLEVYGRAGLLQDARFNADYLLIQRIDTDIYGSQGLLVYQRRAP
jgi:arabinofuranosyltransferase